jgi:hypothetical protein
MARKAAEVVHLLEQLKRMVAAETEASKENDRNASALAAGSSSASVTDDPYRPPKRPWEEMEPGGSSSDPLTTKEGQGRAGHAPTTAEQDMEIIRSKRASTAAAAGQPKSKYRKRSVSDRSPCSRPKRGFLKCSLLFFRRRLESEPAGQVPLVQLA